MNNELTNNSENTMTGMETQETAVAEQFSMYKGMNEVFEHTRKIIETMQQGEKITVKDLADKVHANIMDMPVGNVTNLVQMYVKRSKEVTVEIGRGGGVFKGGKPKRIDNRPRCVTCNQVVRPETSKHASAKIEDAVQETMQD